MSYHLTFKKKKKSNPVSSAVSYERKEAVTMKHDAKASPEMNQAP